MAGDIQSVADENEAEIKSKTDNQYYNFTLKRKNIDKKNKNDIISLNLRYDKKTYVLLYMNVVDGMGNTITYALQHPQLDVPIPESVFNSKR